jgi:uncharacterized membrane-anchored protein
MDFKVGDTVKRKNGSTNIGVIVEIYTEGISIPTKEGRKHFASAGDCAVRFDSNTENGTIPFSPAELEKV